jgi:predicted ATPase
MADRPVTFEREVRAALARLHDLPYLQTHPLGGLRGRALHSALTGTVEGLRSGAGGASGRAQRLLALRYVEGLDSPDVAARLGVSMGEYYREHAAALAAVASLLGERLAAAAPATAPVPAPAVARARSLPRRIDAFIGREQELGEVRRLLAASRLVTMVGPGGVGKTRLVLEALDGLSEPDSAWLVELAPLADGTLVAPTVSAAVGAPVADDPARALVEWLGTRSAMLLLDNCEHLVEACAALAATLLGACPGLRILATSREPLGVPGEQLWPLPPLRPDEAARLFVARARLVQPGFEATAATASAVASICAQLDGIPLAIELAAARAAVLSPAQIADRLRDRFHLLTGGSRTALPRHRTLQALFDWSHELLTEPERVLFRRLAIFAGGWTLEGAEAVCGFEPLTSDDVLGLLASLVQKSLVVVGERGSAVRYRFLETVRQYAHDRLTGAGEVTGARDRHRDWVALLAARLHDDLAWTHSAELGDEVLDEEPNVRAALEWCRATAPAAGLRLAWGMAVAWQHRGRHAEAIRWLEELLELAPEPTLERAEALTMAGRLRREIGDVEPAVPLLRAATELFEALGARPRSEDLLTHLALCALAQGDRAWALAEMERALVRCRAEEDELNLVNRLREVALVAIAAGEYARARACLNESIERARRDGRVRQEGNALSRLGTVAQLEGDLPVARALLEEGLALMRRAGFRGGVAGALGALASVARAGDDGSAARAYVHEMLTNTRDGGYDTYAPFGLAQAGLLRAHEGDHEGATRLLAAIAPRGRALMRMHNPDGEAEVVAALERARASLGDEAFARAWAEGATMSLPRAVDAALEAPSPPPEPGRGRRGAKSRDRGVRGG